jgi:hypothetical protein
VVPVLISSQSSASARVRRGEDWAAMVPLRIPTQLDTGSDL